MKIKNAAKKIGSAIYEMEQKSAEKPRILGSSQKQIIFLVLIIIFSFWVGYKLLSYSILDGDKWRMMATDQQLSSVVIKANRGSIYDANGTTLAQSSTEWDLTITPHNIDHSHTNAVTTPRPSPRAPTPPSRTTRRSASLRSPRQTR